jgi:prepilin peptidase CpaA
MGLPLAIGLLALLSAVAWHDALHRRIPNALVAAVALLWLGTVPSHSLAASVGALATAGSILGSGMLLWRCGLLGGGDVKLMAALGLWAGPANVAELVLVVALSGGALALGACLVWRSPIPALSSMLRLRLAPFCGQGALPVPALPTRSIPYGVAIASGGCWLVHRLSI